MPTPEEGLLEVNKQYQETAKVAINIVIASFVLPVAFLKIVLNVQAEHVKNHLPLAFWAWGFLTICLLACLFFYYYSTKFAKAVYKVIADDPKVTPTEREERKKNMEKTENTRDGMAIAAGASLLIALILLIVFFVKESISPVAPLSPVSTSFQWCRNRP